MSDEVEEQEVENEKLNSDVHFVHDHVSYSHLTKNDYEDSMILNQINEVIDELELMNMRQYDLRPR